VDCYSIITGVDEPEFAMNEFNIYPNPANNAIYIDLQPGTKLTSIEIMDKGKDINASTNKGYELII
jgi:hypothetical protein